MNEKQKRFVEEYLIDLNGTQAAIRAGYSPKTAEQIAHQLLNKTLVSGAIGKAMAARSKRTGINADRVLREYARIGFADMGRFTAWGAGGVRLIDSTTLSEDDRACIQEITETEFKGKRTLTIKLHDKKSALDSMAKHLGLFDKKQEDPAENQSNFKEALETAATQAWEDNTNAEDTTV
jgi:phage terminase small subunit